MWRSRAQSCIHHKHLAQSGHSTRSAVDIFLFSFSVFTKKPIRGQEMKLECMNRIQSNFVGHHNTQHYVAIQGQYSIKIIIETCLLNSKLVCAWSSFGMASYEKRKWPQKMTYIMLADNYSHELIIETWWQMSLQFVSSILSHWTLWFELLSYCPLRARTCMSILTYHDKRE